MTQPGIAGIDAPRIPGAGGPRRLLIDLSEVVTVDYGTGIHRVVRNLTRALLCNPDARTWTCVPVAHDADGSMHSAHPYAVDRLGVPSMTEFSDSPAQRGDVLLLLDSAWENPQRFLSSIERTRAAGGLAGAFVYDLIPLRFPQYCVDFMPPIFERWLRFVVAHCDFLVCISRAVADDLDGWIDQCDPVVREGLRIGHVYLGSDIEEAPASDEASAAMREAMDGGRAVLMVGTVEPRKRHDLALAAFEGAWAEGSDLRLVIAGKRGWNVEDLVARIRRSPWFGRRLFWIEGPTDQDLSYAYAHALRLLQASDAEGFGLPIVEAAHYATPLLLSGIPVFREIAGGEADYFTPGDMDALRSWISIGAPRPRPSSPRLAITWQESAGRLLELLEGGPWDHEGHGAGMRSRER